MDLAAAVPVIIPGPFVDAVADRGMSWVTPSVALSRIGIQLGAANRQVFHDALMTHPPVRVVAQPKPLLACVARDEADDGGPIVRSGAQHLGGGGRGVHSGLAALPQGMERRARQAQLAGQAGRRLTCGSAAGAPAWPVVAASLRRRSPSTAWNIHRTPDSGRPGKIRIRGTGAAWRCRSGGM